MSKNESRAPAHNYPLRVPPDLWLVLKHRAERHRQSVNAHVLSLIEKAEEAEKAEVAS
jgi:hypothetical protein